MVLYVIRHAHAGHRSGWHGADEDRPLSSRGEREAKFLAEALMDVGIDRLWSSPFVRCRQTLGPLGVALGLEVTGEAPLTEGTDGPTALDALLAGAADGHTIAACSHGDVIPLLIRTAVRRGADLDGPESPAKAARYQLNIVDGGVTGIVHIDAPRT